MFRTHLAGPKSFNVPAQECQNNARGEHTIVIFECATLKDAGSAKCVLKYLVPTRHTPFLVDCSAIMEGILTSRGHTPSTWQIQSVKRCTIVCT